MRGCVNQKDNMEHALEHGTMSTPVHHPLYLCPFPDIYKSHEMGERVIALNADSVGSEPGHLEHETGGYQQKRNEKSEKGTIKFVKTGQTTRKKTSTKITEHNVGLLNRAINWELRVDTRLRKSRCFLNTTNPQIL